jgi:hypothetical protein
MFFKHEIRATGPNPALLCKGYDSKTLKFSELEHRVLAIWCVPKHSESNRLKIFDFSDLDKTRYISRRIPSKFYKFL